VEKPPGAIPSAWCAGCGKEVSLSGHYAHGGRTYHLGCLKAMLTRRRALLVGKRAKTPEEIDEELDLEESLKVLEGE